MRNRVMSAPVTAMMTCAVFLTPGMVIRCSIWRGERAHLLVVPRRELLDGRGRLVGPSTQPVHKKTVDGTQSPLPSTTLT